MYKKTRFLPPLNEVQGVYRINLFVRPSVFPSVRLSVCLSVRRLSMQIHVLPVTFLH